MYCDECHKPCGECNGELRDLRRVLSAAKKMLADTSETNWQQLNAYVEMAEEAAEYKSTQRQRPDRDG